MRLWQHIRRVLWAVSITFVLALAAVECLYRATLIRLPTVASRMDGVTVPMLLVTAPWVAEEGSAVLQVRRLVPWTLLRVLTAVLRARKGRSSSSAGWQFGNQVTLQWTRANFQNPSRLPWGQSGLSAAAA